LRKALVAGYTVTAGIGALDAIIATSYIVQLEVTENAQKNKTHLHSYRSDPRKNLWRTWHKRSHYPLLSSLEGNCTVHLIHTRHSGNYSSKEGWQQ
jgi:hypothetical protein